MTDSMEDNDFLDHPDDIMGETEPLSAEDGDMFVLFAEALDSSNPKTIDESRREWEELFR